ncbi:uncharacterized protein LOC104906826 isoform X1 [Beta vulgaris subsp. vulgaris]|uniref:uncharacterized protein LOC104906826 isoform X1 n=1 Tax=Beta vulgaris subsp. vulgaris TaxID=3555 RepID=UPI002036A000|nr:uncharacterized protein LOC104906826 isoform X1 [Beta vulgaris subsp. vulgaris]XP_010693953.2 uncharacterized protein LOC104906826 isoform X1 [Beta vulgaris subsp. vulgaris]
MASPANVVGFVGFDDMSLELAASLVRSGYAVQAFDSQLDRPLMVEFSRKLGGTRCANAVEATRGVAAIILLISHPAQIDDIIFGREGILEGLKKNVVVVLRTVILSSEVQKLEKRLTEEYGINVVVDAHICRGTSEDLDGKIVIISSGKTNATARARPFLSAMCEKLYVLEGEIGAGSKVKMVTELLEAIHLVASVEAICLGVQARIHPWILYDIISNAAGNSWVFKHHVPQWLRSDHMKHQTLNNLVENLGTILGLAKSLPFPLPLLGVSHQQLLGCSHGSGDEESAPLFKVWGKVLGIKLEDAANEETYNPLELAKVLDSKLKAVNRVGFIGLGAMGFGMATHLLRSSFTVTGYDVYEPTLSRFIEAGGLVGNSPLEVSKGVDVLVIMVANEAQAESVLFGDQGAIQALSEGAAIILSSTVSPAYVAQLEQRLQGKNLKLVDAPVSGGVKRACSGTLTVMASGTDEALKQCVPVLSALSEKLYIIKGGCGAGSCVKMVNQLLAGVHIASAAEALAFGARLGLHTRNLFQILTTTSGTSWMLENRGPHMVDNDFTPYSQLNIFVKDLGIVSHECASRKIPLHVAVTAHQLFLAGSAAGWGTLDDAAVVKFYESLTGVKVEGKLPVLSKENVMKSLPLEWPVDLTTDIIKLCENNMKPLVVLDDDPTGTQTVHDIEVLTEWNVDALIEQFKNKPKCFFILTNSRALSSEKASALVIEICRNLQTAAKSAEVEFTVVLRGDSTLRGHFPEEADAVASVIGEIDASIICPFFLQGGRFTIGDIHYVAEADRLIPAGDTEFARDSAFGYKSSNLREWVEEKTEGRIEASNVSSVSIELLRKDGPNAVCAHLCSLEKGSTCIVNAASERDMAVFAAGMILAELKGKRFLCRTAASFVSARVGITSRPPISPKDLGIHKESTGGLIIVGSYVPKTTRQVEELQVQFGPALRWIEISVTKVAMNSPEEREKEINLAAEMADISLRTRMDTVIMTSRELISGKTASESLEINFKVSSALVEIVRRISTRPRYILAKGGITSSDIATRALDARHAKIVGQALAGVPLWQLGGESRHPGVPYIVFPGNVGDHRALAEVVKSWARPSRLSSSKELLLNAERGGYAVGAFNVYNLEGVASVVAAAEEERSPAILQIHPGALKQGGIPLVACCLSAVEQSSVPLTVHFDHGTSKQELLEMLEMGFDSVMVDGSHLPFEGNIVYTKFIADLAHQKNICVEAELGRLSGTEDELTVEEYEARFTDINQAEEFIDKTGIDALAVCIGNVHGKYPVNGPNLKLDLLKDLHALASSKGVILVLHGASGLPQELVKSCIDLGVRKFNVNTEVRKAYVDSLANPGKDLVNVMTSAKDAMKAVVVEKMRLFGSSGKA